MLRFWRNWLMAVSALMALISPLIKWLFPALTPR